MDVGRPELCTGPVAESYPPQCGGPPIREWRWADHEGDYEQVGKVRWGAFVVDGYFDGERVRRHHRRARLDDNGARAPPSSSAYASTSFAVTGPPAPDPITRPSTDTTGVRPPMVPVTNASSAV